MRPSGSVAHNLSIASSGVGELTSTATASALVSPLGRCLTNQLMTGRYPPSRRPLVRLGVQPAREGNVKDQPDTADAFSRRFDVTYPTAIDANTGSVQLAFAGKTAPNATPATFVLDPQGRVSARVLGAVDPSILRALVKTAAATPEQSPGG